jgi:hypothetical protein
MGDGGHGFVKLSAAGGFGWLDQRLANPFLQPQRRRLEASCKLRQTDAKRLPNDIGFAQIGGFHAFVDLRGQIVTDFHFRQRFHCSHFNVILPLSKRSAVLILIRVKPFPLVRSQVSNFNFLLLFLFRVDSWFHHPFLLLTVTPSRQNKTNNRVYLKNIIA